MSFSKRTVCDGKLPLGEYIFEGVVDKGQLLLICKNAQYNPNWRNIFSSSLNKEETQKLIEFLQNAEALL